MEDLNIPVANCDNCDILVPVYVVDTDLIEFEGSLTVVICTVCDSVLNNQGSVKISYYNAEGLEALGWEIADE